MYTRQIDSSFKDEQAAREYAAQVSATIRTRLYIILAGDEYFVTTTKSVQPYEKFIASYASGFATQ